MAEPETPSGVMRTIRARPGLIIGLVAGVVAFVASMVTPLPLVSRGLIGWDVAVLVFLGFALLVSFKADTRRIRKLAIEQDAGRHFILLASVVAAAASVAAIVGQLSLAKDERGLKEAFDVALAIFTIALSWLFVQMAFAFHYAHVFWGGEGEKPAQGLKFPGERDPDYWDFVHFAIVIGAAAQTADIAITSRGMRRLATAHTLVAFTFNSAILAVMINVVAGMI